MIVLSCIAVVIFGCMITIGVRCKKEEDRYEPLYLKPRTKDTKSDLIDYYI